MKKVLATVLVLCSLFYSLQAKAASSLAHATPTVNVNLCQIFMKEYSRPLIDMVRISVPLRAFASMLGTLNVRDNYAIKLSAFNRLMQTNKKYASTVKKAKANGFRLCPVVPDDYAGMNLDSYAAIVHNHLHVVEEKMNEALK